MQQTAEEKFDALIFLLGESHDCIETRTDAVVALLEQAESDPQNIWNKLLKLAVQLAGECLPFVPI